MSDPATHDRPTTTLPRPVSEGYANVQRSTLLCLAAAVLLSCLAFPRSTFLVDARGSRYAFLDFAGAVKGFKSRIVDREIGVVQWDRRPDVNLTCVNPPNEPGGMVYDFCEDGRFRTPEVLYDASQRMLTSACYAWLAVISMLPAFISYRPHRRPLSISQCTTGLMCLMDLAIVVWDGRGSPLGAQWHYGGMFPYRNGTAVEFERHELVISNDFWLAALGAVGALGLAGKILLCEVTDG